VSEKSPLFVGLAQVELHLPGARSLKDKRHDVRSLVERLKSRFAVLVIESDHQELHQRAGLAITALATEADAARGTLAKALDHAHQTFDGMILDEHLEVVRLR
jgi:uncharacterized protein YlxP (DUF503 family)